MPSLGDVYVDVHANTKGLPGEVRRGAKKIGAEGDRAGRDFSDGFDRGFARGRRRSGVFRSFLRLIAFPFRVAAKGFSVVGKSMAAVFNQAGEGASTMAKLGATFASLGVGVVGLAGVLGMTAGAFAVLLVALSPIVTMLSLLTGMVVALASSISFALVGAVGALVAVIGPAVAGLGVLGLAFIGMSDKAKESVKKAFKPLKNELQGLGKAARAGLFSRLPETIKKLEGPLKNLRPLVRGIGEAIAGVGFRFAKAMQSPGFKAFRDSMEKFLPFAIRKLGGIARQTLGGLGGVFRGMVPFMRDVLTWLDKLTQGFSDWANSAAGQTAIEGFFRRVSASAKAFGGFVKQVSGLIGDLFSSGRGTGDSIFTSMEGAIKRFRTFLKENPDALKNWFKDAEAFGKALGDAAVAAGKVLDALDSPGVRSAVTTGFEKMAGAVSLVSDAIDILNGKKVDFNSILGGWGDLLGIGGGGKGKGAGGFFKGFVDDAISNLNRFGSTGTGWPIRGVLKGISDDLIKIAKPWTAKLGIKKGSNWGAAQRLRDIWNSIKDKTAKLGIKKGSNWGATQRLRDIWSGIRSKAAKLTVSRGGNWGAMTRLRNLWDAIKSKTSKLNFKVGGSWGGLTRLKNLWGSIKSKIVTLTARRRGWAEGGLLPSFARGGRIPGSGPSNRLADDRMGLLNNRTPIGVRSGEFIVNEQATKRFLPLLQAINDAKRFAAGGRVDLPGRATGGPADIVFPENLGQMSDAQMRRQAEYFADAMASRKFRLTKDGNLQLMALGG